MTLRRDKKSTIGNEANQLVGHLLFKGIFRILSSQMQAKHSVWMSMKALGSDPFTYALPAPCLPLLVPYHGIGMSKLLRNSTIPSIRFRDPQEELPGSRSFGFPATPVIRLFVTYMRQRGVRNRTMDYLRPFTVS